MVKKVAIILSLFLCVSSLSADTLDPYDPFDTQVYNQDDDRKDDEKSVDELLLDATILMNDERLLDARTKLLNALKKDPKEYRTHMMLAGYYIQHVGHFRLALKYTKQALNLFIEKNGKPPYTDARTRGEHSQILYLLSQARLSLDDYQGSLEVLDEYSTYNYYASWYAGTRAWVLMKLNRLDEAIKVARLGAIAGYEPGRTLNMLGILLSMNGEREDSLKIFRDAITYEMALGTSGQPATPLNNSGEVYKEIFEEDKAETSWLKATRMPDGCEHVLPSLNLALLYIEEQNFQGAKNAMNNFESCVAQYPLRNGEEHKALVNLVRGRVYLHAGNADKAIELLDDALEERQWFGKIGTSIDDMLSATMISLSQALTAKNNQLALDTSSGLLGWAEESKEIIKNEMRAWWLMRRATQILTENLNDLEDIYVRNTDSMLEYPTFGELLARLPTAALENRLSKESKDDNRSGAVAYYKTWLAENYLNSYREKEGMELLDQALKVMRPRYDNLLKTHALILQLEHTKIGSEQYARLDSEIFELNRAKLRDHGLQLFVNYQDLPDSIISIFQGGPFYLDNSQKAGFLIRYVYENGEHVLTFVSASSAMGNVKVKGTSLEQVTEKFIDAVFIEDYGKADS
jgi:Tfp pilus assembly protein PilF